MGYVPWGSDIPALSWFRLLVASVVLGAVVAVGAIAFLAACEVVTRLALTECAGYQPGGPAGETVLVPSAVGGSPRVWLLVPIAVLGGLVTGWVTRRFAPEAAGPGAIQRFASTTTRAAGSTYAWQSSRSWRAH
jgi:H+/Cl- antiporter ClcA